MGDSKYIVIRGARQHNLKNVTLKIPRDKLVVITGPSGSGKSSLAFDTIYAEGQRRYVESLSAYARQFLEQMEKPDMDSMEGLPPTIAIEQRSGAANPRSTVATTTEIYDYLRLLFARAGIPHCPKCGREICRQTPQEITEQIMSLPAGSRILLLAPLVRGRKGYHRSVFERVRREGYVRVRVDGEVYDVDEVPQLDRYKMHDIDVVVDRLIVDEAARSRINDSVETALKAGEGVMTVAFADGGREDIVFSQLYACPICRISLPEMEPRSFSFNSPYGACPSCGGLGTRIEFDPSLIVPDRFEVPWIRAFEPLKRGGKRLIIRHSRWLRSLCRELGLDPLLPFALLPEDVQRIVMFGSSEADEERLGVSFEGVVPYLHRWFHKTSSDYVKRLLMRYMTEQPCPECGGARLRKEVLAVTVGGKNIREVTAMSVEEAYAFFSTLRLDPFRKEVASRILREVCTRLEFLLGVGLGYLTLDRRSSTLSGGEAERIRLATQIGSGLVGVCYVLDEPTIGLHPRDGRRLLETLLRLRDMGNTVIVVEHDESVIRAADYVVDLGPGAGVHGGEVVAEGTVEEVCENPRSVTGSYLSGRLKIQVPRRRRSAAPGEYVEVVGAREHNLKNIDVRFPLGVLCCVTGVSGSGKSTLVDLILYRALARKLHGGREVPGKHVEIRNADLIDKVIRIDQSPIGRTPRSNPATYTKLFDEIRRLFASLKESRIRGYNAGRFSFNVKGGRCEACQGQGIICIEMHFLPDVYVECRECRGKRYNEETLAVKYRGKSIADVLEMTVEEAIDFFRNIPRVKRKLERLRDVGLGYMPLGQSSTTLSGGEAQRVKLAAELGRPATGNTLYILDEPTTGLHFVDISNLLGVLNDLVDRGNTVVVIEHNMDVIKCADYVVDLGPEGGDAGGRVVACGRPEDIVRVKESHTGRILERYLDAG